MGALLWGELYFCSRRNQILKIGIEWNQFHLQKHEASRRASSHPNSQLWKPRFRYGRGSYLESKAHTLYPIVREMLGKLTEMNQWWGKRRTTAWRTEKYP